MATKRHRPPTTAYYALHKLVFGLESATGTLHCAMEVLLMKINWQFALVYSYDTVMYWRTPEEHIEYVRQVFTLLNEADVTHSLMKCEFFNNCMDYLGHVIRLERLEWSTRTIDAVRGLQHASNLTELRSFFGLCNVFRRFVPNLTPFAAPLNKKPQKGNCRTLKDYQTKKLQPRRRKMRS